MYKRLYLAVISPV